MEGAGTLREHLPYGRVEAEFDSAGDFVRINTPQGPRWVRASHEPHSSRFPIIKIEVNIKIQRAKYVGALHSILHSRLYLPLTLRLHITFTFTCLAGVFSLVISLCILCDAVILLNFLILLGLSNHSYMFK